MDFGSIFILNLPSYTIIAFNMKIFSIFTLFLLYSTLLNAQTASKDTVKVLSQKDMQAAELKYNEAYILLQSNKNAEAITKFAEAISIKANFPEAYYNRAVAKIASDDLVGCINDLNRVITLKPEPKYFHARGVARFKYKDFSGALEDFGKSIAAGKSTFLHESHYYTGLIYFNQKKNSEAIKSLSAALQAKPDFLYALHDRAAVYFAMGNYTDAHSDYSSILRVNPKFTSAYINNGRVFIAEKNYEAAALSFENAIKYDSNAIAAYINLGNLSLSQQKFDQSAQYIASAIELNAQSAQAHLAQANLWMAQMNYSGALAEFNESIKKDASNPIAFLNRGICKEQLRDKKGACDDWNQASGLGSSLADQFLGAQCKK
jgi:tetratricopeptide (TPR) repeat protein